MVGQLDLRTGSVQLVNAGHVSPYLVRESRPVALDLPVHLPLGLFRNTPYRATRVNLQPGDRLVFLTDGTIERNADTVDLPTAIAGTVGMVETATVTMAPTGARQRTARLNAGVRCTKGDT